MAVITIEVRHFRTTGLKEDQSDWKYLRNVVPSTFLSKLSREAQGSNKLKRRQRKHVLHPRLKNFVILPEATHPTELEQMGEVMLSTLNRISSCLLQTSMILSEDHPFAKKLSFAAELPLHTCKTYRI